MRPTSWLSHQINTADLSSEEEEEGNVPSREVRIQSPIPHGEHFVVQALMDDENAEQAPLPRIPLSPRYATIPPSSKHMPPSHRRQRIHQELNNENSNPSSPFRQHSHCKVLSPPLRSAPPPPPQQQKPQYIAIDAGNEQSRFATVSAVDVPNDESTILSSSDRMPKSSESSYVGRAIPTREQLAEKLVKDGKLSNHRIYINMFLIFKKSFLYMLQRWRGVQRKKRIERLNALQSGGRRNAANLFPLRKAMRIHLSATLLS